MFACHVTREFNVLPQPTLNLSKFMDLPLSDASFECENVFAFFLVFRLRDKTRQAFSRIYHLGLINLGKFPFRLRLMFDFHSISLNDT